MLHGHRFKILLATLALLFVASPFIGHIMTRDPESVVGLLTMAFMIAILVSAINAVSTKRREALIAAILFAPTILLRITYPLWEWTPGEVLLHVSTTIGLAYTVVVMTRQLFRMRRVTLDMVAASLCTYLLLAIMWADVYALLVYIDPDAFIRHSAPGGSPWTDSVGLYFSLVTISTLGYGDIVPQSEFARMVAAAEAVSGQFFLAVLVARLVGIHAARHGSRDE